jgi:hypothetical protein
MLLLLPPSPTSTPLYPVCSYFSAPTLIDMPTEFVDPFNVRGV